MNTVIKVMESLVKMNKWEVIRFDIQHYEHAHGIEGYVGYLTIGNGQEIRIRQDGSFEYVEE